jgi:hypothetical protein
MSSQPPDTGAIDGLSGRVPIPNRRAEEYGRPVGVLRDAAGRGHGKLRGRELVARQWFRGSDVYALPRELVTRAQARTVGLEDEEAYRWHASATVATC